MQSSHPSLKESHKVLFGVMVGLLMLVPTLAHAGDFFPTNTWVTMRLPHEGDPDMAFRSGAEHVSSLPIPLEANRRYTLKVNWNDGDSRFVSVLGFNPKTHNYPSGPSGTTSSITVNVGGSNIVRDLTFSHTFSTADSSPGNLGYVTFIGRTPNQEVRVMVTDPAEPDEQVMRSINGRTYGQIAPLDLYLRESMGLSTTKITPQTAIETIEAGTVPLNQWVEATLPQDVSHDMKYRGGNDHIWTMPVAVEKGGEYTFMARWDDKKDRLISVLGFNPLTHNYPSVPKGMTSVISINVGSNNRQLDAVWKRNFSIDPNSGGSIAYVAFSGKTAGQKIEFFIASPKESDEQVLSVINGARWGRVVSTPLHVRAD